MAHMNIYLAFENAKSAIDYYVDVFNATLLERIPVDDEKNKILNINPDQLENSTFFAKVNFYGCNILFSDRFESSSDFSDSVNIILDFDVKNSYEESDFFFLVDKIKQDSFSEIIFEKIDDTDDNNTFRFRDKYNVVWTLSLG